MSSKPMEKAPAARRPATGIRSLLRLNRLAQASALVLLGLMLVALLAPWIARYPYDQEALERAKQPPSVAHPLGTDELGRDVLSRVIYGSRVSLKIGIGVELIELLVGGALGLLAGFYRGRVDGVLMRLTDVMFAFPDILLAILVMSVVRAGQQQGANDPALLYVFVALGLVGWPGMARLVRGQVLSLREKEFVEAARALGLTDGQIMLRHLAPNCLAPVIVAMTVGIGGVILAESTLSFLGIGVRPPTPSWGRMIYDGLRYLRDDPILTLAPATVLAVTVLAFNFLGDGLRDLLDPRLRDA